MSEFVPLSNRQDYQNVVQKNYQGWKDVSNFTKETIRDGVKYEVIAKKEYHFGIFQRIGAVLLTAFTIGAAAVFSKSIRDVLQGKKVVYFGVTTPPTLEGNTKLFQKQIVDQQLPIDKPVLAESRKSDQASVKESGNIKEVGVKKQEGPPSTVKLLPRNGNSKEIKTTIGDVSHLTLSEGNLEEIFRIANKYTLDTPYQINDSEAFSVDGKMVPRPNHNGTHSARGTRYMEAMFDLIGKKGSEEGKQLLQSFTKDEILNLKLAAYFLRAGRVDESTHMQAFPDDYYTRSAQIYEAYAKQLGVDDKTREWIKTLITDSCKPLHICSKEVNENPKSRFAFDLLSITHRMDLVRCYDAGEIEHNNKPVSIKTMAPYLLEGSAEKQMGIAFDYAEKLCRATGATLMYKTGHYSPTDKQLFAKCSHEGDFCWQTVKEQPIPTWA